MENQNCSEYVALTNLKKSECDRQESSPRPVKVSPVKKVCTESLGAAGSDRKPNGSETSRLLRIASQRQESYMIDTENRNSSEYTTLTNLLKNIDCDGKGSSPRPLKESPVKQACTEYLETNSKPRSSETSHLSRSIGSQTHEGYMIDMMNRNCSEYVTQLKNSKCDLKGSSPGPLKDRHVKKVGTEYLRAAGSNREPNSSETSRLLRSIGSQTQDSSMTYTENGNCSEYTTLANLPKNSVCDRTGSSFRPLKDYPVNKVKTEYIEAAWSHRKPNSSATSRLLRSTASRKQQCCMIDVKNRNSSKYITLAKLTNSECDRKGSALPLKDGQIVKKARTAYLGDAGSQRTQKGWFCSGLRRLWRLISTVHPTSGLPATFSSAASDAIETENKSNSSSYLNRRVVQPGDKSKLLLPTLEEKFSNKTALTLEGKESRKQSSHVVYQLSKLYSIPEEAPREGFLQRSLALSRRKIQKLEWLKLGN